MVRERSAMRPQRHPSPKPAHLKPAPADPPPTEVAAQASAGRLS
jgi:hypothetical protein